jgi:hypothetical protein
MFAANKSSSSRTPTATARRTRALVTPKRAMDHSLSKTERCRSDSMYPSACLRSSQHGCRVSSG